MSCRRLCSSAALPRPMYACEAQGNLLCKGRFISDSRSLSLLYTPTFKPETFPSLRKKPPSPLLQWREQSSMNRALHHNTFMWSLFRLPWQARRTSLHLHTHHGTPRYPPPLQLVSQQWIQCYQKYPLGPRVSVFEEVILVDNMHLKMSSSLPLRPISRTGHAWFNTPVMYWSIE